MDELTEDKARQMDAGPELNRVCAEFIGWFEIKKLSPEVAKYFSQSKPVYAASHTSRLRVEGDWPPYSTDWSAAGPLLEAIQSVSLASPLPAAEGFHEGHDWRVTVWSDPAGGCELFHVDAPTPQLAIARACAVLVARGINRDDLEVVR